jgi:hypothetical protein
LLQEWQNFKVPIPESNCELFDKFCPNALNAIFFTDQARNLMKKINTITSFFLLYAIIFLAGCATTLSNQGALVRVTNQSEDVKTCNYLGQITSSSGWGGFAATGLGFESAMNELRNKAGAMGANVLLTQVISNTMGGTRMIGDAYICK